MPGFMKTVLKKSSVFFFSPDSKDDVKIKRNVSLFSSTALSSFSCSPLIVLFIYLFFIARSDFKAFWCCEIKVHMAVLVQNRNTVFINSVIHMYTLFLLQRYSRSFTKRKINQVIMS